MQSLWKLIECIVLNTHTYIVTIVLGGLCDNIGLVGVSAKWSYVTASSSHHDQAIPILSPLLFMHVGHPYIPLFKIRRIFSLLVACIIIICTRTKPAILVVRNLIVVVQGGNKGGRGSGLG